MSRHRTVKIAFISRHELSSIALHAVRCFINQVKIYLELIKTSNCFSGETIYNKSETQESFTSWSNVSSDFTMNISIIGSSMR